MLDSQWIYSSFNWGLHMKPSHFWAAAAISLATIHPAIADTWQFTYSGFYSADSGSFVPEYQLGGTFSANDTNHDNRIDRSELTDFAIGGNSFFACPRYQNYHSCNISSFSYALDTRQLNFETHESKTDPEGYFTWYTDISTGNTFQSQTYFNWRLQWSSLLNWTDQTVLSVSGPGPAPVPEPETYAMLLAGLGLMGGAAVRRKSR